MIGELSTIAGVMFRGDLERGGGVQRVRRRPSRTTAAGSGRRAAPSLRGAAEAGHESVVAAVDVRGEDHAGHWDSGTATPDLASLLHFARDGAETQRTLLDEPALTDAAPSPASSAGGADPQFVRAAEAAAMTARMEINSARIEELKQRMEDVFGFPGPQGQRESGHRTHARSAYRTEGGAAETEVVIDVRG